MISPKSVKGSSVMIIVIVALLLLHFVAYVSMCMSNDLCLPLFPQASLQSINNAFFSIADRPCNMHALVSSDATANFKDML